VAAAVAIGGALVWQARPSESRATSTLVVLPDAESVEVASYYDTLSSGQIASTFAEILALRGTENITGDVEVEVVPDTSLIQITVTAADAATAEAAADAALTQTRPYFDQLSSPYDVFEVQSAAGTAEDAGLALELLTGVVAAVAVVAGLATYLAVRGLQQAGNGPQRRTQPRAATSPAGPRSSDREPTTAPQSTVTVAPAVNGAGERRSPERHRPGAEQQRPAQPAR